VKEPLLPLFYLVGHPAGEVSHYGLFGAVMRLVLPAACLLLLCQRSLTPLVRCAMTASSRPGHSWG
jgi:hypothetical protein